MMTLTFFTTGPMVGARDLGFTSLVGVGREVASSSDESSLPRVSESSSSSSASSSESDFFFWVEDVCNH